MASTANDREKALETALAQIERAFGKGSVMRLGEEGRAPVEVIPTGSIALDLALGIGGYPRGRIVEIYGPESSGKTTVALHAIANVQAAGGLAAFIDAEHALDPDYASKLGVDLDNLYVAQPDTGEQALEIADTLVRSGAIDLIVIDSVAALVPRAEIEGEMGDSHMGLQARLMSQALRKMAGALSNTNTTAIFINQLRDKIGVMFGSPETTTGGKALKFYASVRLDVRRIETLKGGTEAVNIVAAGIGASIKPGDEIVLSIMEHHSNIVPWHFLRERKGAVLNWVDTLPDGSLDMDSLARQLGPKTRVLALTHMSNVLGTVPDVKAAIAMAHAAGAQVLLDQEDGEEDAQRGGEGDDDGTRRIARAEKAP
jgi:protein RecA